MTESEALNAALHRRSSCRGVLADPVPQSATAEIVLTTGNLPSSRNTQPWPVTVTPGAATDAFRNDLKKAAQGSQSKPDFPWPDGYPGAYGDRRRACGYQLYEAAGIAREDRDGRAAQSLRNFALFDAPHVAIVHSEVALGPYGALDCAVLLPRSC